MTIIPASLRRLVEQRANVICEYCLMPSGISFYPHEVDHIVALKHGGGTVADNLAYACWRCNRYKGTDLGSFDPQTHEFSLLFNPRLHSWDNHFVMDDYRVIGLTPEGRTTAHLLQMNTTERIAERRRAVD